LKRGDGYEESNYFKLVDYLKKHGIDSRHLFLSMPTQCPGFEFLGYKLGQFPEAEYVANNGFHIGIHQELGRRELDYFVSSVEDFLALK
jgi:dTDP-4-amino-4,6-dideoxygalactose transaminase